MLLFRHKIKIEDFNLDNILIDQKSCKDILVYSVYNILYKSVISAKHLRVRFDKINGFIGGYDGTRYLVLFKKYGFIETGLEGL